MSARQSTAETVFVNNPTDHGPIETELGILEVIALAAGASLALQLAWLRVRGVALVAIRADRTDRGVLADLGPFLYMRGVGCQS